MLYKKQTIVLEPPPSLAAGMFEVDRFECPLCHGAKVIYPFIRDKESIKCPMCRGAGEIAAVVHVTWKILGNE